MENCVVREIKDFNRLVGLFLLASSMKDENAKNYSIEKMQKRWHNYKLFTVLEYNNAPVSFSGVYDYGNNLVRVCDRHFTNPDYRQKSMTKNVKEKLRPVVDWFIPYQTKWAKENGYDCFFSIQTPKKRNAIKRVVKLLDDNLGYKVLPGLYATCNPKSDLCWQNIAATTDKINLPYKSIN